VVCGFTHVVGVVPGVERVLAHLVPPLEAEAAHVADEGAAHIVVRVEHEATVAGKIRTIPLI